MSHDSNAMRIAAMCVISLVGYWAFIEAENYEAPPSRIGPGAAACGSWQKMMGRCGGSTHVRAEGIKSIAAGYSTN